MKKNLIKILTLTLSATLLLTACGGAKEKPAEDKPAEQKSETKTLVVGATPEPHAAILEAIKPQLEKEGINLEVKVINDYVIPNTSLEEKELDANFFQHQPYLDEFNSQRGTNIISTVKVHVEPMGLYSSKIKSLDELADGATISIPNDPTNGGRALLLLQKQGLITLKEGAGLTATDKDIEKNDKNLKFELLDAAQLPRTLEDVDASVINTNYALEAKLNPTQDAIVIEDKDSPYANLLATREDLKDDERIKALEKALNSEEAKKFIEETYKGAVVPAF